MPPDETSAASQRSLPAAEASELAELRATCQRQQMVVEMLSEAVSTMRDGMLELKAENAGLSAENADLRARPRNQERARRFTGGPRTELRLPLDDRAPRVAHTVVGQLLEGRIAPALLQNARLLVCELAANSLRHSGGSDGDHLVIRTILTGRTFRLEVEDPGIEREIEPRSPDFDGGGGFGLYLVQTLSESWGVERLPEGGTRVWAEMTVPDAPRREASDAAARASA